MPSAADHLAKAEHNERFAEWLSEKAPEYFDWVLNGTFYAAVHVVEAVLARRNHHSGNHADRGEALHRHFRACYRPYQHLKNLSIAARHSCNPVRVGNYKADAYRYLQEIKTLARGQLK